MALPFSNHENNGRQHNIKMYRAKKIIIMETKLNSQAFETTVIISRCRSAGVLERVNIYRTPLMQ
jgi:hypothetical protein